MMARLLWGETAHWCQCPATPRRSSFQICFRVREAVRLGVRVHYSKSLLVTDTENHISGRVPIEPQGGVQQGGRMERKLTAIFSADVQGYSRLMGEDEEATIRTLTAYRELM